MNGWLGDFLRTYSAWWYWNTRKSLYVLRGRKGRCPCHNNSDFGAYGDVGYTRCDAVLFWKKPERFSRRVCPLLVKNEKGDWVCGVPAAKVKPFWGRVVKAHVAVVAGSVLIAGFGMWGTMRLSGFHVSLRQVFWPPAWSELRQVRGDYFREQARGAFANAEVAKAVSALLVAREMNPTDYETAMLLAQLYQVVRPELVDGLYLQVQQQHPERAAEVSRVWCRSLLSRAQMQGVAALALTRLEKEPASAAVWTHALVTAARWSRNWSMLKAAAENPKIPAEAREVCALEWQLRTSDPAKAKALLEMQPAPKTPYAALHRVERLIEFNDTVEALEMLRVVRGMLGGRDFARLTLAANASSRPQAWLERENAALLSAHGADAAAAVAIVAQNLIRYPNAGLLTQCHEAFSRLPVGAVRDEAAAALYCAAALAGRHEWLPEIRKQFTGHDAASLVAQQRIEERLRGKDWSPLFLLTVVRPVSVELNYAILERIISTGANVPKPVSSKGK